MISATPHPADTFDVLHVFGARENNLNNVQVSIPKRRLPVCTGGYGSGKSSLIFSTSAADAQRLVIATYSTFVQGFMPPTTRPEVDRLAGLTTTIAIDQEALPANPRSTVGTVTDVHALLRLLYSRVGTPHIGGPQAFAFNVASVQASGQITVQKGSTPVVEQRDFSLSGGMCPVCEGRGSISDFALEELYNPDYSLDGWYGRLFRAAGLDLHKPIIDYADAELDLLLYREPLKVQFEGTNLTYEGIIPRIRKSMLAKDREAMQPHIRKFVDRAIVFTKCTACEGTRLNETARSVTIDGINIGKLAGWQADEVLAWINALNVPAAEPLLLTLRRLLEGFVDIGLGYLS